MSITDEKVRRRAAQRVADAYDRTISEWHEAMELEREFVKAHLQPGQDMPKVTTLTGTRRDEFSRRVEMYRADALAAVKNLRDRVNGIVTEAPSDEHVRALQVYMMRDDVSDAERRAFLDRYGDNYQARRVLKDRDVLDTSEYDDALASLAEMEENVTSVLDAGKILDGTVTPGSVAFSKSFIPEKFSLAAPQNGGDRGDE